MSNETRNEMGQAPGPLGRPVAARRLSSLSRSEAVRAGVSAATFTPTRWAQ